MHASEIASYLDRVRQDGPLVHNITNFVTMNNSANAVLAVGGSPAMIHSPDEVSEFVAVSNALVINIGTIDSQWLASMRIAAHAAGRAGIPWVLDPVGASVSRYRMAAAMDLLGARPTVLRANGSEVGSVSPEGGPGTRGADSTVESRQMIGLARKTASAHNTIVAMTGGDDYVTDGDRLAVVRSGHPLMTRVTALGCSLSAVAAAFIACVPSERRLEAAVAALAVFGACGRRAARNCQGPGQLQMTLLDELYACDAARLAEHCEVEWL